MNKLIKLINNEIVMLKTNVEKRKRRMNSSPDRLLRISNKHKGIEYYYKERGTKGNGKYIRKKDMDIARQIAQKDYDKQLVSLMEDKIKLLSDFSKNYEGMDLSKVYLEENSYRKNLIFDSWMTKSEYAEEWQNVSYKGKEFPDGAPEIITEKGERVRSKSEKIIADKLYYLGIPYRYEYPLKLEQGLEIYPDFTILDVDTMTELYLEHFGMMDDKEYIENFIFKLNTYARNGIYLGKNLFFTYETSRFPLNVRALDGLLKSMFSA